MVYKFVYSIYIKLQKNLAVNSIAIRIFKRLAEKVLSIYFTINPKKPSLFYAGEEINTIVSLTTFPARIEKVWLVIESILYQTQKPDKLILWLYCGEFNSKESLPDRLLSLEKRGLEIRFCGENLMPHKKYFYTIKENPSANVITIDDDMFYPPDLINILLAEHEKNPTVILCPITREIKLENGKPKKYKYWPNLKNNSLPSFKFLTMGGGGSFFPCGCLSEEIFNFHKLKIYSLKADDLWIKVMSLLNDTKVKSLAGNFSYSYLPVFHKNRQKLMDANVTGGNNDKVFKNLLKEYDIDLSNYIDGK